MYTMYINTCIYATSKFAHNFDFSLGRSYTYMETSEGRDSRLQVIRARQHDRLASETAEQREAQLSVLSAQQRERLASETVEQKEAQLKCVECSTA